MELRDGIAVVTGGASGIGAAVVERLAAAGARPVVWDVAPGAAIACDVGDAGAVDAALARTVTLAGVPTLLVACAGVGHGGALLDVGPAEWDRVLATNAKGAWLAMRAVARAMIDTGRPGAMVAVSSVSGHLADRGMGVYCASKAALDMVVRVAAAEWAPHGIRVNAVAPGVTDTPMLGRAPAVPGWREQVAARTPLGRLGTADDVAEAVVALLRLDWVTGQVLLADGGLALSSPIDPWGAAERARRR